MRRPKSNKKKKQDQSKKRKKIKLISIRSNQIPVPESIQFSTSIYSSFQLCQTLIELNSVTDRLNCSKEKIDQWKRNLKEFHDNIQRINTNMPKATVAINNMKP